MSKTKSIVWRSSLFPAPTVCVACAVALSLLSACSVNVKKEANGDDKQVDINSPFGGIHVDKQADASDVGLAIYPGARLREDEQRKHCDP